jgi:hypothetical protein
VLLYIEAVTDARKFMSAARACARAKPVIVIKGGRYAEGAKAASSHTGALAGAVDGHGDLLLADDALLVLGVGNEVGARGGEGCHPF